MNQKHSEMLGEEREGERFTMFSEWKLGEGSPSVEGWSSSWWCHTALTEFQQRELNKGIVGNCVVACVCASLERCFHPRRFLSLSNAIHNAIFFVEHGPLFIIFCCCFFVPSTFPSFSPRPALPSISMLICIWIVLAKHFLLLLASSPPS